MLTEKEKYQFYWRTLSKTKRISFLYALITYNKLPTDHPKISNSIIDYKTITKWLEEVIMVDDFSMEINKNKEEIEITNV